MSDRLASDAKKMVGVVDDLLEWMLSSRPDLEGSSTITYVQKWNDRLRESVTFDLESALDDSATRGRITDPTTTNAAADIAKIRAGSQKQKLGEVYFQYPQGLTAEEAVKVAGLHGKRSPWHRVSDLKMAGVLRATGRERATENNAPAEVLTMTLTARTAWRDKYGELPPAEILSIFGTDVEVVRRD